MIYIATNNLNDGFPLSNAYDDTIYQKANSEYYLKFRYPIDRFGVWKNLTCETVLKADDARGVQLFRIKKINKINGYIRVYAKHITDDINFIEVNQLNVTNATGKRVMTALAGSIVGESRFVFDSDIATMHTLNLSDTTAGDILSKDKRSIIGQWGGELIRDNFLIDLKARGGVDTETLFMNKKNVKNQDNSISTENLITRLKLSVEVEKENSEKEVIKATVESPYINTYPRVYTGYLKVTDKNVIDREKLIEYGKRYFRDTLVDFPKDNLTVNVIDKNQERINLFDTVWFRNVEYGIDKRLKVVAYEYSPMSKRYIKISFGALKINSLSQVKNLNQLEERIDEKIEESRVDAFKIQKNLADLLKKDRTAIEEKMKTLEEQSKAGVEVKKALFEKDGTVPEVTRTKILDAVEADIARLKTIITEAEMIKAIQAHLDFAEIKTALINKAFITKILSDETFRQEFEAGEVTTQNIFTKMRDSIQSSIKKEFITKEETKKLVNDLTIGADGIRQITEEETNKIIDNRKNELKGDSSYIHKKYSNNANGTPMTDDVNSKYMGIYTGTSKTPPVNASDYNWIKIKFEERLVKGYANSKTGLDFTTVEPFEESTLVAKNRPRVRITNNNDISDIWQANDEVFLKPNRYYYITIRAKGNANELHTYIKDYNNNSLILENLTFGNELQIKSTTFVTPKNLSNNNVWFKFAMQPEGANWEGVEVDWWTIQEYGGHDNFRDFPLNTPAQYHKFRYFGYANITDGKPTADKFEWFDLQQKSMQTDKYTHLVYSDNPDGTDFGKTPKKYMGIARTTSPVTPTNKEDFKWFKITGEDGKKGEDGHSLNAYLRLEGSYLNGNIANFGAYVKVMYDGVQISDFDISHSYRGASFPETSNQASTVDSNGLITNLGLNANKTDGTPLYVDITVKYKGLTSVASARLDNTVDVELVNNTINKFKTFESTLENFESTIKEIDNKKFKMAYNIENLCSETQAEKKGNDLYFQTKRPLEANKYYYILAYLKNVPDGRLARIYYAENNGDNKSITNGLNIWRIKYNSPQTRVNIFSQGSDTTVKNVEIYEVPEVPFPSEDVLATVENTVSYFNLKFNRKVKSNEILKLTFDVKGNPTINYGYYCEPGVLAKKPLVEGVNTFIFKPGEETDKIQFSNEGNGLIGEKSNFKCVKITFDKGYKNEYNISDMESSIKQTKASIDLSVKKNDVISSINLTPEAIKIDSKRVDVTGLLTAYTGAIGGFLIGKNPNDNENWWITGQNQFRVGMSNGGGRWKQTALWVNWGYDWGKPSDEAWFVKENGEMYCYNKATFSGGLHAYNERIDVHGQDVQGDASGSSKTTVIWWSQISRLRSAISDKRLKENIQPTKVNALDTLNKIEMVEFNWKKDGKFEKLGAIAQQVKSVEDSLVVNDMDDKQTFNDHLRINYYDAIPYLIKAVQELSGQVDTLTKRVEELERSKKDGI